MKSAYKVSINQKELNLLMFVLCDYKGNTTDENEALNLRKKLDMVYTDYQDKRIIFINP